MLVEGWPATQATLSVVTEQLLLKTRVPAHMPVRALLLSTTHRPNGIVVPSRQIQLCSRGPG